MMQGAVDEHIGGRLRSIREDFAAGHRFHDLRHPYPTWLVAASVPINDAQRLLGLARASTTLDLYTHHQRELNSRVYDLFADDPLTTGEFKSQAGMPTAAIMPVDLRVCVVGLTGFEPATPSSRTKCATKLRYIPIIFDCVGHYASNPIGMQAIKKSLRFCPGLV